MSQNTIVAASIIVAAVLILPLIISRFLRTVDAGTIRLVSWLGGSLKIYRGPGKSVEIPVDDHRNHHSGQGH